MPVLEGKVVRGAEKDRQVDEIAEEVLLRVFAHARAHVGVTVPVRACGRATGLALRDGRDALIALAAVPAASDQSRAHL